MSPSSKGRGVFSVPSPNSPAPVPKKASELNNKSKLQGQGSMKVRDMMKDEARQENMRGRGM
ncbi:MAG: hypothetical protein ABFQ95_01055 [Pseudomonadota bacterium]